MGHVGEVMAAMRSEYKEASGFAWPSCVTLRRMQTDTCQHVLRSGLVEYVHAQPLERTYPYSHDMWHVDQESVLEGARQLARWSARAVLELVWAEMARQNKRGPLCATVYQRRPWSFGVEDTDGVVTFRAVWCGGIVVDKDKEAA